MLLLEEIEQRNEQLKDVLIKLSKVDFSTKNDALYSEYISSFKQIYDGQFRHSYSVIFGVVAAISKDAILGVVEKLLNNIYVLVEYVSVHDPDLGKQLYKLYDHINLDWARMEYVEGKYMESLQCDVDDLNEQCSHLYEEVKFVSETVKSAHKDNVTILSIFSAVLLACVGSFIFSSSVLANLHKANGYRIAFAVILIAIVVINVLEVLFKFLDKVIKGEDKNNCNFKWSKCANVALCLLLGALSVIWYFGGIEYRNKKIGEQYLPTEYKQRIERNNTSSK